MVGFAPYAAKPTVNRTHAEAKRRVMNILVFRHSLRCLLHCFSHQLALNGTHPDFLNHSHQTRVDDCTAPREDVYARCCKSDVTASPTTVRFRTNMVVVRESLPKEYPGNQERISTVWLKGMSVAVLVALAWPAHAADDVRCSGVWFHDGDRDRVGHCIMRLDTDAFLHIGQFCGPHGHCAFLGHVAERAGDKYVVDRIKGSANPPQENGGAGASVQLPPR